MSRWGLYEYTVMPFGLTNAPATFQRLMNEVLREHLDDFVTVYLDDILIFSKSDDEHARHLQWVLGKLREHGLFAKRTKCAFGLDSVEYLGHVVTAEGISPDPAKIEAITTWPAPTDVQELRVFLGMANYYQRFVPRFAHIAAPLTELLRKDAAWTWGSAHAEAFEELKHRLSTAPILLVPDFSLPFQVGTDASQFAIGAELQQDQGKGMQPVQYYSRKLNSAERNYHTGERELLAIVAACKRWRPYLAGKENTVLTDHKPLTAIYTQADLSKRQVRWMESLAETRPAIIYREGKAAVVPDALSRRPHPPAELRLGLLSTLIVEPSFLQRVSAATFDGTDTDMSTLVERARGQSPDFRVVSRHGVDLLVRVAADGTEQLVIPRGGGLR